MLDSLSPLKVVERGYSIVTKNSEVIKSASQVKKGRPFGYPPGSGLSDRHRGWREGGIEWILRRN
ncbi:hypothetical protein ACES2J_00930 [Bdellovibrio bacteriovorus]|uniref:hypothetical protein n=1 Tax=Bdellovibrio bacteriovorus TaxID=959 RepID=UPI0035A69EA7